MKIDSTNEILIKGELITYLITVMNGLIRLQRTLRQQAPNEDVEEAFQELIPNFDALIYNVQLM